jgi:hypothetical protein
MPDFSMAGAEEWAAGLAVTGYAIDDQTAIKVSGGTVAVISEGPGGCLPPNTRGAGGAGNVRPVDRRDHARDGEQRRGCGSTTTRRAVVIPSRRGSARIEFPNELEVLITREFDAPIALVFDVLTKPEHVRIWGGGGRDLAAARN